MNPNMNPIPQSEESPGDDKIIGYCRTCGRALTEESRHVALGTVFCSEHMPHIQASASEEPPSPYAIPPNQTILAESAGSPALAFLLGFIPGVGAIYNGQYAKGLVHVLVFGMLVSILSSGMSDGFEPLFGILLGSFVFYQCFEAYHTAKLRAAGQKVDELSGLIPGNTATLPIGPVILIGLGALFLLGNLGLLNFRQIVRYWPVILILIGVSMLLNRTRTGGQQ
jgi:hypothetical protein